MPGSKPAILVLLAFAAASLASCVDATARQAHLELQATRALARCGIPATQIRWRITGQGAFAFAPAGASSNLFTEVQAGCIADWARRNGIKVAVLGLE